MNNFEQNVKLSFSKIKEDISSIKNQIKELENQINSQKEEKNEILSKINEVFKALEDLKSKVSTGNEGVNQSINHLINQSINQSITNQSSNQIEKSYKPNKMPFNEELTSEDAQENVSNQSLINQSFNQSINHLINQSITKDQNNLKFITENINKVFLSLTKQELKLFLTIYQLEDESIQPTYKNLSLRMQLSEHCIRSHTSSLLRKNIPLAKSHFSNRTILLSLNKDFKALNLKNKLINMYYDSDPHQKTLLDI